MICTYLYNTQSKHLELLDENELLARAPDEAQIAQKNASMRERKWKGAAFRGSAKCREDEFIWVDVTEPKAHDFQVLSQRFGLHAMVVEDIRSKEGRPKLHNYSDYLYLIFFGLKWREREALAPDEPLDNLPRYILKSRLKKQKTPSEKAAALVELKLTEIDCLVGPDFIVTIHDEPLAPLDDLRDRWLRRPDMMRSGTGYLLYELMDEVLDDYFPLLDALDERIDLFEEKLYHNQNSTGEDNIASQIFALKRSLISIRRVAGPTRDVVNVLLRHDADTGGKNFAYYQDLYDHASRIVDTIDNFREIVGGALDAYLATESNRMNQVMKTLTACSIILFVPNLIAAIYGMNFENMPELKNPGGYHSVLAFMAISIGGMVAYFKRLKWL